VIAGGENSPTSGLCGARRRFAEGASGGAGGASSDAGKPHGSRGSPRDPQASAPSRTSRCRPGRSRKRRSGKKHAEGRARTSVLAATRRSRAPEGGRRRARTAAGVRRRDQDFRLNRSGVAAWLSSYSSEFGEQTLVPQSTEARRKRRAARPNEPSTRMVPAVARHPGNPGLQHVQRAQPAVGERHPVGGTCRGVASPGEADLCTDATEGTLRTPGGESGSADSDVPARIALRGAQA